MAQPQSKYAAIIERIFWNHYKDGQTEVPFERSAIAEASSELGIIAPKNLGDVVYSYRYRKTLPQSVLNLLPAGKMWIIRPEGIGKYRFLQVEEFEIVPSANRMEIKIPDSTPGLIALYAQSDEQALLAKVRYNRLLDIFSGVACYSLQSHYRTAVKGMGQIETDEVYVGLDRHGAHYVFPMQAKGGNDILGVVQIEQDLALCRERFPDLICRPIAAQFMGPDLIAMFELTDTNEGLRIAQESHYRLVDPNALTPEEVALYKGSVSRT